MENLPTRGEVALHVTCRQTQHLVNCANAVLYAHREELERSDELQQLRDAILDLRPYLTLLVKRVARMQRRRRVA